MSTPILSTKLFLPPPRTQAVPRPRLLDRLDAGLNRKLTLVSAPAGFGKTTLLGEWLAGCGRPLAWLSLDKGDGDPAGFLTYLIAALQTIHTNVGKGVLGVLQSPQPPPIESILTVLLNDIAAFPEPLILILDDYHAVDSKPVDDALVFLVEHLPRQMHLVIATREDPDLPLSGLRARGELTELRAADLRFTNAEAADFLNRVMGLSLSAEETDALEARTEGWIAGLQLAAVSMQGHRDAAGFIKSFTGSHRFVLDYLVDEVLEKQSESVQSFLRRTAILDSLCGPLCDAVLRDSSRSGQETLEYLEHANLFLVPLDDERRWYRYHHLFADLLRQRLQQSSAASAGKEGCGAAELHLRASQWYEDNGRYLDAFHHATAANDVERAERLMEGKGMSLHSRGAAADVLSWLASLPAAVKDARPLLWVRSATIALMAGQTTGVEEKLLAAENAVQNADPDDKTRDLTGQIAAARATLALTRYQPEIIMAQSRRAMEYLRADNFPFLTTAKWTLAFAHYLQGNRPAAIQAYVDTLAYSQAAGDPFSAMLATSGLADLQEMENQLYPAAETYRRLLQLCGDQPLPNAGEAHLGLARISYEWNDLDAAERHGRQSLPLARQFDMVIDRYIISEVFLARVMLARGDGAGAAAMLAEADRSVREHNFVHRIPDVTAERVRVLLGQGHIPEAARLAEKLDLPVIRARVLLAQGDPSAALDLLLPLRREMDAKDWKDERLKVMVLQAVALQIWDKKDEAVRVLSDALALAEPGGFIRTFIDEGAPMAGLLSEAEAQGIMPDYTAKLLAAVNAEDRTRMECPVPALLHPLIEPLSEREVEVLRLVALGLSNREIGDRLSLALDTVKGHNRRIFDKLQVQRRTEAIARARDLGLI